MSSHSSSSSYRGDAWLKDLLKHEDCYHLLLLNPRMQPPSFLMHCKGGTWSLPIFDFPKMDLGGRLVSPVCEESKSWLGLINNDVYFTGGVELIGERYMRSRVTPNKFARAQLLLIESHGIDPDEIDLPPQVEWKTASFVDTAFPDRKEAYVRIMVGHIKVLLNGPTADLETLLDERYRLGWFEKASHLLEEMIVRQGGKFEEHVRQLHMSNTSTVLRLESSLGSYFLKSTVCGCNERKIIGMVAELFPQVCPDIVESSEELNCFVSKGFDDERTIMIRESVMALGKLQLESLNHIDRLKETGCPVRDVEQIMKLTNKWPDELDKFELSSHMCEDALPVIEKLCEELKEFQIPMVLVHGDFHPSNMGYMERDGRRDLVTHDWEYGHIGNPFCDFHRVHKFIPEDVLEEYLLLWTEFESIDRVRRAYDLARDLGWALKACTVMEWANRASSDALAAVAQSFAGEADEKLVP